ncbi:E3 SUMO-protein ligase PIAS4 isoform X2 [Frankliniella occidentalis]|uniref:E3 SUMO-protein ligase PIAS4 isoform X2 n=1 Tax=Frankliniella occidentalis TaxID=133901 RepID=A0A6J1T0U3_FRAOC|nr:E3 SUMO-protein ligase PIAS4 isoform X2 [Frankliniella occidentalis]
MGDKHNDLDYPRSERSSRRQQVLAQQSLERLQQQQALQLQQQRQRQAKESAQAAKRAKKADEDSTAELRNMLMSFRVSELQMLLGFAGRNKSGRKTELQARALELLRLRSEPVSMKIRELFKTIQESMGEAEAATVNMYRQQGIPDQGRMSSHSAMQHGGSAHGHPGHPGHAVHSSHPSQLSHPSAHMSGMYYAQQAMQQQQHQQAQHHRAYPTSMYGQPSRQLQPQPPVNAVHNKLPSHKMSVPVAPSITPNMGSYPIHPDVRLKKLPFYEMMGELLKPSTLMPQGSARMQESNFVFHLTPHQATEIAMSRDTISAKNEYTVQVQMRFCLLETSCDQDDCFPPGIAVKVNGKQCSLPNPIPTNRPNVEPKRPPRPVNISPLVKLSPTVANHITVQWGADYAKQYVIAAHLVKKLTSTELLQKMKSKGVRHPDFTRGLIKEKLSDADAEIATTSLRVSLMCPLGKMRMSTPCRASTCIHLQCFDASLYLLMNERKPTWICPVCDKECLYDNLVIDGYFQDVIQSGKLPSDSHEIQLHPDGSWTGSVTVKKEKKVAAPVDKNETVEIIDDLEIIPADDDTKPPVKEASPKKSGPKAVVVDLTLSDSDDDTAATPAHSAQAASSSSSSSSSVIKNASPAPQQLPSTPSRFYADAVSGGNSGVSSSGNLTITLDDSPSPPSRPTPTVTPNMSAPTNLSSMAASSVPNMPTLSLPSGLAGSVPPAYPSSMPYLHPATYLDVEDSAQAASAFPYSY